MNRKVKIVLFILSALFIIIQFIPYGRPTNHPVSGKEIFQVADIPAEVGILLKNACYDCHSQRTKFPWYSHVAPVSWLVASDINEGREHLDFSLWGNLTKKEKLKVLDKIGDEVGEKNMPLQIFTLMHAEARLTDAERSALVKWAEGFAEKVFED